MENKPTAPAKYAGKFKVGECETEGLALKLTVKCPPFFFFSRSSDTVSLNSLQSGGERGVAKV